MWRLVWACLVALLPAIASAQKLVGLREVPTDTTRHGVLFEIGGPGELYSLNYERRIRPRMLAQVGFTRWSFQFLAPRQSTRAGISTLFYEHPIGEVIGEWVSLELGGGFVAGTHRREDWYHAPEDTLGAPLRTRIERSPWLSLTGLAGLRIQEMNGGFTYRMGWTPLLILRDLPDEDRRPGLGWFAMSIGYTW